MAMAAQGKSNIGIPQSVGQEFMRADPGGKLPERAQVGGGLGAAPQESDQTPQATSHLSNIIGQLESQSGKTAAQQPKTMVDPYYGQYHNFTSRYGSGPVGVDEYARRMLAANPNATLGDYYSGYVLDARDPTRVPGLGALQTTRVPGAQGAYGNLVRNAGVPVSTPLGSLLNTPVMTASYQSPERQQAGGEIHYQKPSAAFRKEHPTTSKGPVSQQQRRLAWATVGGADTGMPVDVARRFARSDAPGKLPKFVEAGKGLGHRPKGQFGGAMTGADMPSWTRAEARSDIRMDAPFSGGLIPSSGAGRTDQLPLAVAAESHVLPADVVAGIGQGNTLSGARLMMAALRAGPWGMAPPHIGGHAAAMAHPPPIEREPELPQARGGLGGTRSATAPLQTGGGTGLGLAPSYTLVSEPGAREPATNLTASQNVDRIARELGRRPTYDDLSTSAKLRQELQGLGLPGFDLGGELHSEGGSRHETSILAAGGEFIIPREDWAARDEHGNIHRYAGVRTLGEGDIGAGHQRLNQMIHKIRAHQMRFLRTAPPPKD